MKPLFIALPSLSDFGLQPLYYYTSYKGKYPQCNTYLIFYKYIQKKLEHHRWAIKEERGDFFKIYSLGTWDQHFKRESAEIGSKRYYIILAKGCLRYLAERNIFTKFEENLLKIVTYRAHIHKLRQFLKNTQSVIWSEDQDRSSSRGHRSGLITMVISIDYVFTGNDLVKNDNVRTTRTRT